MTNTQDIFTQLQSEISKLASVKPEEINSLSDKIQNGIQSGFSSVIDEVKKIPSVNGTPDPLKAAGTKWYNHFLSDKEKGISDPKEARRIAFNRYVHAILK